MDVALNTSTVAITDEMLKLVAEIDEFRGAWKAIGRIAPERLSRLRRVAAIESIASSTRIEGARLSDQEVERKRLHRQSRNNSKGSNSDAHSAPRRSRTMHTTQNTEPERRKAPLAPIPEWLELSKEERATWLRENGKGYLSKEEREERLRTFHGDIEYVYMGEADRALKAKDNAGCQQWLSLTRLPAHYLSCLKIWYGADFIRGTGFDTSRADKAYGPGWLER